MEQVEGGDLVVNRGDESRPKDTGDNKRELNPVEGYEAALKLAQVTSACQTVPTELPLTPAHQANLEELIKRNAKPEEKPTSSAHNPTTYSYVYLRVQPYTTTYTLPHLPAGADGVTPEAATQSSLQFLICLSDPNHKLIRSTVTQASEASRAIRKKLKHGDPHQQFRALVVS